MPLNSISILAPADFPLINVGDQLADIAMDVVADNGIEICDGDVLVFTQKIVSKAEGRYANAASVIPSEKAAALAAICRKDAGLVELILRESCEVVRCMPGVIIVRNHHGLVLANAGIDQSNIDCAVAGEVLLQPADPDASATRLKNALEQLCRKTIGVMIIDSLGRAWRQGTCGACIGSAGIGVYRDLRGNLDLDGRTLMSSTLGVGDEIAASASLAMGQGNEGIPFVIVRGIRGVLGDGRASDLVRPLAEDLFR